MRVTACGAGRSQRRALSVSTDWASAWAWGPAVPVLELLRVPWHCAAAVELLCGGFCCLNHFMVLNYWDSSSGHFWDLITVSAPHNLLPSVPFISTKKISLNANLVLLLPIKILKWPFPQATGFRLDVYWRFFMTDPHLPPSQCLLLPSLIFSPMNRSRFPPDTVFHTSVLFLTPFLLLGMFLPLAISALLSSGSFPQPLLPLLMGNPHHLG